MKNLSLRSVALVAALCFLVVGMASASSLKPVGASSSLTTSVTSTVPFPTAGDAYCSLTNGCGTIPSGGQTDFQFDAGDFVISSIFVLPTTSVTGLSANWNFQDFLGNGNTETWFVYVNGVAVAQTTLPDDNYNGDILNVGGAVSFAGIAPVSGGYQVELVLQNTVPFGGGSVAWLDGGLTGLSYTATPEPGSMMLFGSGVIGVAGLLRRKLNL
ncbi:MAG TPA: PEP-CTERM sorting domain-containing protein [Terriglobales bacterium]